MKYFIVLDHALSMAVIVGGTFSVLHRGHKALLGEAIKTGERVIIGLTSDEYAEKNKVYPPVKYSIRYRNLSGYMARRTDDFEIHPIDDRNGNAPFGEDYHYLIVSPETYRRGLKINEMRAKAGLPQIKILKVNYVLAEDLFPISSSRIIKGEISRSGRRIVPVKISISTHNEAKVFVLQAYVKSFMKNFTVTRNEDYTLPTEQPIGDDTLRLAIRRSMDALKDNDYGAGVESGLMYSSVNGRYMDVHYCSIIDRDGRITIGSSSGFEVNEEVIDLVKRDRTFYQAYSSIIDTDGINERDGVIGRISGGRLRREDLILESIRNAFLKRFDPLFYEQDRNPYRE